MKKETATTTTTAAPSFIQEGISRGYFGIKFTGKSAVKAEVKFLEFSDGYNDNLELNWTGGLSGYNRTGLDEATLTDIIRHFGSDSIYRIYGEMVSGGYFLTYNIFPVSEIGKKDITARKPRRRGIDDTPAETGTAQ